MSTYLEGNLLAGDDDAGIGLRYGDFRDRGYMLSLRNRSFSPEVDKALSCSFYEVAYVAGNLDSAAIDELLETDVAGGEASAE